MEYVFYCVNEIKDYFAAVGAYVSRCHGCYEHLTFFIMKLSEGSLEIEDCERKLIPISARRRVLNNSIE
jgi:hypothetical protein